MTVVKFPKHHHPNNLQKCLHCEIFNLVDREFPDIGTIELTQKIVEVLAELIRFGADPGFHNEALREVQDDLGHVLEQVVHHFPPRVS